MGALLDLSEAARRVMPPLGDVDPKLRAAAARTWRGRMVNEHGSAPVFEGLAKQLTAIGARREAAECARMAGEERNHGVLCGAVVEAFGERAEAPALPDRVFPEHEDVHPVEAVTRNLMAVGCLAETVAVAIITAERESMPEGALRDLLGEILADEVGHARFGWKWIATAVPEIGADGRARLGSYLARAFAALERHELMYLPAYTSFPKDAAALGLCDGAEARATFYATVDEVIVPRLEALGVPAASAWRARA